MGCGDKCVPSVRRVPERPPSILFASTCNRKATARRQSITPKELPKPASFETKELSAKRIQTAKKVQEISEIASRVDTFEERTAMLEDDQKAQDKRLLFDYQLGKCVYCGNEYGYDELEIEHMIPKRRVDKKTYATTNWLAALATKPKTR